MVKIKMNATSITSTNFRIFFIIFFSILRINSDTTVNKVKTDYAEILANLRSTK